MAKFDELNENLMNVLYKLISSQNLCKLLTYTSDNPFLEADIADTSTLLFDKIFPIPKIPDIQTNEGSMVTVIFDDMRLSSGNIGFKDALLCINVFCHIDKWQMKGTGKLRPYAIMQEIDTLLNNERVVGVGKDQFYKSRFIAANEKFMGYKLDYSVVNFNW